MTGNKIYNGTDQLTSDTKNPVFETITVLNPPILSGFMDYNDTSTSTAPITLLADTWTTIPNDGLGAFTNK